MSVPCGHVNSKSGFNCARDGWRRALLYTTARRRFLSSDCNGRASSCAVLKEEISYRYVYNHTKIRHNSKRTPDTFAIRYKHFLHVPHGVIVRARVPHLQPHRRQGTPSSCSRWGPDTRLQWVCTLAELHPPRRAQCRYHPRRCSPQSHRWLSHTPLANSSRPMECTHCKGLWVRLEVVDGKWVSKAGMYRKQLKVSTTVQGSR